MARVNVESSAFVLARRLAEQMGWDEDLALGKLTRFWHDSQLEERTECRLSDLRLWFRIDATLVGGLAQGLVAASAIEECGSGLYRIRGNSKHIEALRQRREAARENGKRGGRPPNSTSPNPPLLPSEPTSVSGSDIGPKPSVTQPKPAMQSSSEQSNAEIHMACPTDPPNSERPGSSDFERLYAAFPKRGKGLDMAKSLGMQKCQAQITTWKRYRELEQAVMNYAAHVRLEKAKDPKWVYSKQWGRFMAKTFWVDWITPPESHVVSLPRPKTDAEVQAELARLDQEVRRGNG